uniref:Uncharacterized protein n=1 Tax=Bionectria ochroleuca TaxID=29856 RepID=A0A8H7N1J0_BIOOC
MVTTSYRSNRSHWRRTIFTGVTPQEICTEIANLLRNEAPLQAERLNSVSWKPRMDRLITRDWASRGSTSRQESSKVEPPPPYTPEDSGKGSKSSVQVTEKSVDEGEHS